MAIVRRARWVHPLLSLELLARATHMTTQYMRVGTCKQVNNVSTGWCRAAFLMPLKKCRESRWRTKALNSLYTVCCFVFFSIGKFHNSLNIWVISKTMQEHSFCDLSTASRWSLGKFQLHSQVELTAQISVEQEQSKAALERGQLRERDWER